MIQLTHHVCVCVVVTPLCTCSWRPGGLWVICSAFSSHVVVAGLLQRRPSDIGRRHRGPGLIFLCAVCGLEETRRCRRRLINNRTVTFSARLVDCLARSHGGFPIGAVPRCSANKPGCDENASLSGCLGVVSTAPAGQPALSVGHSL